jgi:hypothetical protein
MILLKEKISEKLRSWKLKDKTWKMKMMGRDYSAKEGIL